MNYDLAMMALEGLAQAPMTVRVVEGAVEITGSQASFKELARLCLLLGGAQTVETGFELNPPVHVSEGSPSLRLDLA